MKTIKNISLAAAAIVCAAAFVGCKKEEAPSISISEVSATTTSISFNLNVTNADKVAYVCVEKGQELSIQTTGDILENGTVAAAGATSQEVTDLKAATTYVITVAASGNGGMVSESVEVETEWFMFNEASAENYSWSSQNNYSLEFKAASGEVLCLDSYSAPFKYLKDGTYVVGGSSDSYIDVSDINYTRFVKDGVTKALKGGSVVVDVDLETKTYAVVFDIVLDDETPLMAKYNGEIAGSPIFDEYNIAPSAAKRVTVNDQAAGEFYIKLNDADWTIEMVLDFFTQDGSLTELPAGVYAFSEDTTKGLCFGPKSEISCYNQPVSGGKFTSGSITVAKEAKVYTISIDATDATGQRFVGTFNGEIADMDK